MNREALMEAAKQQGIEALEIYESYTKTTSIQVYEQSVDGFTISECRGWDISGLVQGHLGRVHVEQDDDAMIPFILQAILDNAHAITSSDEVILYPGDASYPQVEHTTNTCLHESAKQKVALLKDIERKLLAYDARIEQVMELAYEDVEGSVSLFNTKGLSLSRKDDITFLTASILVKEGEDQKSAFDVSTLKSLETFDVDAFVKQLAEKAISKLHATQIPSGTYPVLIHKKAMSEILRHCMNQFHGENVAKGISMLKDSDQTMIFDEKITIIDDPLMRDGVQSAPFDDEGVACYQKTLVDHGKLTSFLHNLKSAKLMNTSSTGNGFSGDISCTNLYLQQGDSVYEDMVHSMESGVIITELNGLHSGWNNVTTQFSLQAAGFYVEHGEIKHPVNLITIAGNFLELMKQISMVGSDLEHFYTGVGSPSVLFPGIAVSGE